MDHAVQRRVVLAIISLVVISVGSLYWWVRERNTHVYTVGLVYVPSRAFHEQAGGAIKALVKKDARFKLVEFTAASSSDQLLLSAVCNAGLDSTVDVLVCIGQSSAQTLIKLSQKRGVLKPIVFLGVSNPVELGLIQSIERPGQNATGVFDEVSSQVLNPVDLLRLAKPKVKNILMPYAVNDRTNEPHVLNIKESSIKKGIFVLPLAVDNISQTLIRVAGLWSDHDALMYLVASLWSDHDALMYLEADALATYGPALGKFASQHNVTMFASSPDGIADAALTYTLDPSAFAVYIIDLLKRILINKESPATIPAQLVDGNREFIINTRLCAEQDLKDIDIKRILHTIDTDPAFAPVRGHVKVV